MRAKNAAKTKNDVDEIIDSLNINDRDKLLAGSDHYLNIEEGSSVCKRILEKNGDIPVAFFDILDDVNELQIALAVRSGKEYRNKGYGSAVAKQGMKWINDNRSILNKTIVWGVRTDNVASIRIAEKNGFVKDETSYSTDHRWVNYIKGV